MIDGLLEGTSVLGIVMGTSSDDGAIYQLDNFRLITEITNDSADFDGDGDVDGADFLAWQRGFGTLSGATSSQGDANNDGAVDAADLDVWQSQFGNASASAASSHAAIPEPSSAVLALFATLIVSVSKRKNLVGNRLAS